jgi:hypothetical protein
MGQTNRAVKNEVWRLREEQPVLTAHWLALGPIDYYGLNTARWKVLQLQRDRKRRPAASSESYCFTEPHVVVAGELGLRSVGQEVALKV